MAKSNEPSAFSEVINAGAKGAASPSPAAKIIGGAIGAPNTGEVIAQGLQMGTNAAITGVKKITEGLIRQHGPGPTAELNNLQTKLTIASRGQINPSNKGIEAARQKAAAKQTGAKTGQSTNQGIKNYQNKASEKSAGSSKSSASSGAAKGLSSSSGKSSGSSKSSASSSATKGSSSSSGKSSSSSSGSSKGR